MSPEASDRSPHLEPLSALADGELDSAEVGALCGAWRQDASVRQRWHAYQLIGDVLRSDDLAAAPAHDEAFVAALRLRLDREPVVLAPAPLPSSRPARAVLRRRWGWRAPSAVAAGFVAVAGTVILLQRPAQLPQEIAKAAPASAPAAVAVAGAAVVRATDAPAPAVAEVPVTNVKVIRDARLDRYLNAHKPFGGGPLPNVRTANDDGASR